MVVRKALEYQELFTGLPQYIFAGIMMYLTGHSFPTCSSDNQIRALVGVLF
ncbi:hypothetical protein [Liquorilactobacillus satsumensis]|uniref:hypothetical protein n=1 Tax=Liquorilactobacillus satsumensis TaxID=259059 RepID=UPI0039E7ACC5|nr:hypothetical protein [Liquorilactobacillus satsumensis]